MMTDMTCAHFESRLSEWLENDMDATTAAAMDAHAARCAGCGALVADLRAIARDAAALPALAPSRDLWDGIAARIEAPTIALESRRGVGSWSATADAERAPRERRAVGGGGWWLAAAAAALIVVTAGTTYVVTSRFFPAPSGSRVAAGAPASTSDGAPVVPNMDPGAEPAPDAAQLASDATAADSRQPASAGAAPTGARPSGGAAGRATLVNHSASRPAMEMVYDQEIAKMQAVLDRRRDLLDPATVAILENNLRIIDTAIQESRAALARDPASGFLSAQLAKVLDMKLNVMRTAAMLPART